jgi:septum formation protein
MKLPKLILASGSPRRAEILTSVGWDFTRLVADIDETEFANENPADYVVRLAKEKAEKVSQYVESGLILGADTTVVIDEQIIGKPFDLADARRMLKLLSGREHKVLTGITLVNKDSNQNEKLAKSISGLQETTVKFSKMTDEEIYFLAEKGEPLDKAGAYAVQAQAALFIEEIQGDYWNVVGLPINLVFRLANELMASHYFPK